MSATIKDDYVPRNYQVPTGALANEKGGVGKTTIALAVAEAAYRRLDARVLVVDADIQANATKRLIGVDLEEIGPGVSAKVPPIHPDYDPNDSDQVERPSLAGVFMEEVIMPYETYMTSDEEAGINGCVDLIAAHGQKLEQVQTAYSNASGKIGPRIYNALHRILQSDEVAESYDLVLFDTGPSRNALSRAVMRTATHVVIPLEFDDSSIDGVTSMLSAIRHENNHRRGLDAPVLKLAGLLPNRYAAGSSTKPSVNKKIYDEVKPAWEKILLPEQCFIPQGEVVKQVAAQTYSLADSLFDVPKKSDSEFRVRLGFETACHNVLNTMLGDNSEFTEKLASWDDTLTKERTRLAEKIEAKRAKRLAQADAKGAA